MPEVLPGGGPSTFARGVVVVSGVIGVLLVAVIVLTSVLHPEDDTDYSKLPGNFGAAFTAAGAPVAYAIAGDKLVRREVADGKETALPDVPAPEGVRFVGSSPPRFSADLAKVAFVGSTAGEDEVTDGSYGVYLADVAGGGAARVAGLASDNSDLALSADGAQLAFSDHEGDQLDIFVVQADGSDRRRLTEDPAADFEPAFSPDGKRIVFSSDRDGNSELYVANVDGSGVTRLTEDDGQDRHPAFSPDGRHIAWDRGVDGDDDGAGEVLPDLYVADADGKNVTRLTEDSGYDEAPVYSPDGKRLAFASEGTVVVVNADGSDRTVVYEYPEGF